MKLLNNLVEIQLLRDDDEFFIGDRKLFVNTEVSVEDHRCLVGTVTNVPDGLKYSKHNPETPWKAPMELMVGDMVIMKRNAVSLATRDRMYVEGGIRTVYIKYHDIVGFKRNGETKVINGIVLIEPVEETIDTSIYIPELSKKNLSCEGIVVMCAPRIEEYIEDYKYDFTDLLLPGDRVVFKKFADIPLEQHMHKFFDRRDLRRIYRNDIMLIKR